MTNLVPHNPKGIIMTLIMEFARLLFVACILAVGLLAALSLDGAVTAVDKISRYWNVLESLMWIGLLSWMLSLAGVLPLWLSWHLWSLPMVAILPMAFLKLSMRQVLSESIDRESVAAMKRLESKTDISYRILTPSVGLVSVSYYAFWAFHDAKRNGLPGVELAPWVAVIFTAVTMVVYTLMHYLSLSVSEEVKESLG